MDNHSMGNGEVKILYGKGDSPPPIEIGSGEVVVKAFAVDRNGVALEEHIARIEEKLDRLLSAQGLER